MAIGAAIIGLAAQAAASAGLITALTAAAISLTASFISYAFSPKPKIPALPSFSQEAQARTRQIRQPITPWDIVYGEIRKSGPLTFLETTGGTEYFHFIFTLACHPCAAWKSIYVNDEPIYPSQLDVDGNVTSGKYSGVLKVQIDLGTEVQPFPDLVADTTNWTEDHKQAGRTKAYMRLVWDRNVYVNGIPNVSVRLKGKTVTDTRTSTEIWTPNAQLCLRDYQIRETKDGGAGIAAADVDTTSSNAAANVSDEIVSSKQWTHTVSAVDLTDNYLDLTDTVIDPNANSIEDGLLHVWTGDRVEVETTGTHPSGLAPSTSYYVIVVHERSNDVVATRIQLASSYDDALADNPVSLGSAGTGTITIVKTGEPRYTVNGVLTTDKAPHTHLQDFATAIAGYSVNVGGKWIYAPGIWRAPTVTFSEDELRGPIVWQSKRPRRERFNAVQGTYVSPFSYDVPDEYPAVTSSVYEAEDKGIRVFSQPLDMALVNRPSAATRIAKIVLNRHRRQITSKQPIMLHGLKTKASDVVSINNNHAGWVAKTFEITSWELSTENQNGVPLIGTNLGLSEIDADVFVWDPNTDEVVPNPAPTTILGSSDAIAPTAIQVSENPYKIDGSVTVSWAASTSVFTTGYQVEYKHVDDTSWTEALGVTENTNKVISPIQPGDYDFRVKSFASNGTESDWLTTPSPFTVTVPVVMPRVSGLELRGELANSITFTGKDAKFQWREASQTQSHELGSEPQGGDDGTRDVYFKDFEVRILDSANEILRVEHTLNAFYDYTFEKNAEDNDGTPQRSFTIEVYQRGSQNQISAIPARMEVNNPAPGQLLALSVRASSKYIFVEYTPDTDLDFDGVQVFVDTSSGFTPSTSNLKATTVSRLIGIDADAYTTYYVKVAAFDAFGTDGIVYSPEIEITTSKAGTTDIQENAITTALLQAGAVTADRMDVAVLSAITANIGTATAGVLQNSAGTFVVDLDNGTLTISGPSGQSADDYVVMSNGVLEFYHWTGSTHVLHKAVTARQSGIATNGDTVTIPGYFASAPTVIPSPANLEVYDQSSSSQSQALNIKADNLREDPSGSGIWKFDAVATLDLSDSAGTTVVSESSGSTSSNTYTAPASGLVTTPSNTDGLTVYVNLRSVRGTGTAPTYYKRQIRWRIGYRINGSGDPLTYTSYQTKEMSITSLDAVTDQRTIALTAGSYDLYIEYIAEDLTAGGTFDYGSGGYDYDTAIVSNSTTTIAYGATTDFAWPTHPATATLTLAGYTPPTGWSIYNVAYSYEWARTWYCPDSSLSPVMTAAGNGLSYSKTFTSAGFDPNGDTWSTFGYTPSPDPSTYNTLTFSQSSYSTTACSVTVTAPTAYVYSATKLRNPSATIYIRKPWVNTTTPDNTFEFQKYDWELAAASVLATGTLNWIAFGSS